MKGTYDDTVIVWQSLVITVSEPKTDSILSHCSDLSTPRRNSLHSIVAEARRGVICDTILWSRESLWIIIVTLSTTNDRGFNFDFNISLNLGKVKPIYAGAKLFKLELWQENQLKERRRTVIHEIYCVHEEIWKNASRYYKRIQTLDGKFCLSLKIPHPTLAKGFFGRSWCFGFRNFLQKLSLSYQCFPNQYLKNIDSGSNIVFSFNNVWNPVLGRRCHLLKDTFGSLSHDNSRCYRICKNKSVR